MIDFEIKSRVLNVSGRKGQTAYYAQPKTQQKMTEKDAHRPHRARDLALGRRRDSLSNVVCETLQMEISVNLAELSSLKVSVGSEMMDSEKEVTMKDELRTPKIVFSPK